MQTAPGPTVAEKDARPNAAYFSFHRPRFAFLIDLLRRSVGVESRILDVGRSHLTTMIRDELHIPVDSRSGARGRALDRAPLFVRPQRDPVPRALANRTRSLRR